MSFSAWLAFAVKTTVHSSGEALKNRSTARRARVMCSVALDDVGFVECGLPKSCRPEQRLVPFELRGGVEIARR